MLNYKAEELGKKVIRIDRWFPSSQTCNNCGCISAQTKDLSVREWICPHCGTHHNRDENARHNRILQHYGTTEGISSWRAHS